VTVVLDTCVFLRECGTGEPDQVMPTMKSVRHPLGITDEIMAHYSKEMHDNGGGFFLPLVIAKIEDMRQLDLLVLGDMSRCSGRTIAIVVKDLPVVQCAIATEAETLITGDRTHMGHRALRREYLQREFGITTMGPGAYIHKYKVPVTQ
jgi:hypothetical protein